MQTMASKLLTFPQVESVSFTEEEIAKIHTMAELSGKLELLEYIKCKKEYPCDKEIEAITKELFERCKDAGMFEPETLDDILSQLGAVWWIDGVKLKEEIRALELSNR